LGFGGSVDSDSGLLSFLVSTTGDDFVSEVFGTIEVSVSVSSIFLDFDDPNQDFFFGGFAAAATV